MTDREVKRLSKIQVLTLLRQQEEEIAKQKEELEELKVINQELNEELSSRSMQFEKSGSLAEAAISVSGVINAAQEAANLYLENVKKAEANASVYAQTIRENAERDCVEMYTKARLTLNEVIKLFELQKNRGETNLNEFNAIITDLEKRHPALSLRGGE